AIQPPAFFEPQGDPRQLGPSFIDDALGHAPRLALDRLALGYVRDLGKLVPNIAKVTGESFLMRVGQHGERALHGRVGDRVIVEIEPDIRRLANLDGDTL